MFNKNVYPHSIGPAITHLRLSGNEAFTIILSLSSHDCRLPLASICEAIPGVGGIAGTGFMLYNFTSPETTVKTAPLVAASASSIINRTNTLINYGYVTCSEYLNEETGTLNKKSLEVLNDPYKNKSKI